ncbi:hypothetical protein ACFL20_03575 [Spirochaetota bacterium]
MIFHILAILSLVFSIYILTLKWTKEWARLVFGINALLIISMLLLFGFEYKIKIDQPAAVRRTVIIAVDVSDSTGLGMDMFKNMSDEIFKNYNVEIIPFSSRIKGPEHADSTAMIDSLKGILSYIKEKYNNNEVACFIIITDGNESVKLDKLNGGISVSKNLPHNVIYLRKGKGSEGFDKSVSINKAPRFIPKYKKEKIQFSVNVTGTGLDGVPVELRLNGKNIGTVYVRLNKGYGEGSFDLIVKGTGLHLLETFVAVDSREKVKSNNRDYAVVEGIMKGIRVLHISGHPSVDTSFIRRGLQNIPGVDMISFYILRNPYQLNIPGESSLSLIPFPTDQLFRKELDNFDLIIINDFHLKKFLSPLYINNIAGFVKSGGGLILMGGPESFLRKGFLQNNFSSILPFQVLKEKNWINNTYKMAPEKICRLTSLNQIYNTKGTVFKGLNDVKVKKWGNVFFRTTGGRPLIIGGHMGKGRVLSILTDSFWRLSYNAGISNKTALRSMIKYIRGISMYPVKVYGRVIRFDKKYKPGNYKGLSATLFFRNIDGTLQKEASIKIGDSYAIQKTDSPLLSVRVENKGVLVDKYNLINFVERDWNEHALVPLGYKFLKEFSNSGGGSFIISKNNNFKSLLNKIKLKKPVLIAHRNIVKEPIYMDKKIQLLLIFLALLSFYIKSKFIEF